MSRSLHGLLQRLPLSRSTLRPRSCPDWAGVELLGVECCFLYLSENLEGPHMSHQELAAQGAACEWNDEGLYRDIFLEVPFACFSVGADGLVRAANKRALVLVGYRLSDILGRPVLDLYADTPAGKAKAKKQFLRFRS